MALKKKAQTKEETTTTETTNIEAETHETAPATTSTNQNSAPSTAVMSGNVFINNTDLVETCTEADFGTFVQLAASNGTHQGSDGNDYGKSIEFQGIVQRDVWKMSPGETGEEAKEYFKVSYDGEEDLQEALDEAIEAGYSRSKISKYLELFVLITKCDNEDMVGEVAILSLAPSSIRNWKPVAGKLKVKAAFGKLQTTEIVPDCPAVTFRSTAKPVSWKGNNYTAFEFEIV